MTTHLVTSLSDILQAFLFNNSSLQARKWDLRVVLDQQTTATLMSFSLSPLLMADPAFQALRACFNWEVL